MVSTENQGLGAIKQPSTIIINCLLTWLHKTQHTLTRNTNIQRSNRFAIKRLLSYAALFHLSSSSRQGVSALHPGAISMQHSSINTSQATPYLGSSFIRGSSRRTTLLQHSYTTVVFTSKLFVTRRYERLVLRALCKCRVTSAELFS